MIELILTVALIFVIALYVNKSKQHQRDLAGIEKQRVKELVEVHSQTKLAAEVRQLNRETLLS